MTTSTLTLTDFLLARIAEDELVATNEAILRSGDPYYEHDEASDYERWFTPARVLAECEAKLRIMEKLSETGWLGRHAILQYLALPYADHHDYREEWKP